MKHILKDRFMTVARTLPDREQIYDDIVKAYTSPGRHYHTLDHLEHMFTQLDTRTERRLSEWTLAIFFHDYVLVPGDKLNEQNSLKALYRAFTSWNQCPQERLLSRAATMILGTQTHHYKYNCLPLSGSPQEKAAEYDARLFYDADMSILASPRDQYNDYVSKVRLEYSHLSETEWCQGRKKFLDTVLIRGPIFFTEQFSDCEEIARDNIAEELKLYK